MLRFLFPVTLFLSALLLFSIQPMVAKTLLPIYGGTPAVWTVCMLFFQLVLLGSYGYVWLLSLIKKPAVWRMLHTLLILISLCIVPLSIKPFLHSELPEWAILYTLLTQIGLPLFTIAATAPLLQFTYSQTQERGAANPYFLYSASNLGSLAALLLYPWVLERYTGLTYQYHLWNISYGLYLLLLLYVLYAAKIQPLAKPLKNAAVWSWSVIAYWVFLSFIPCSLMLGVTLYITTDVAATPLFWVLPLSLYLLSFIATFSSKPLIAHKTLQKLAAYVLFMTFMVFLFGSQVRASLIIALSLGGFFILALLAHSSLYQARPKPQGLTLFYFCMALGGVLAGVFNGVLAPHVFNQIYEYPIAMLLVIFILPLPRFVRTAVLVVPVCVFCFLLQEHTVLLQERSFYAVNRVENKQGVHVFMSQSTVHGLQDMQEKKPLNGYRAYYGALKPVIEAMKEQSPSLSVAIMGLGMGTMLCQFRPEDKIKAIEIDQQVIDIASNNKLFTYLRDCEASYEIIKNDGRLAMAQIPAASLDVLVLDAFNSDAIPIHLMTLEAFALYQSKLNSDGVLLINLSNRHVRLLPVVTAVGRSLDLITFYVQHKGDAKLGQFNSEWALLTANEDLAFKIMNQSGWNFVADNQQFLWTDDYSNIISLMKGVG